MRHEDHSRTFRNVRVVCHIDQQTGHRRGLDPGVENGDHLVERKVATIATEQLHADSLNRAHVVVAFQPAESTSGICGVTGVSNMRAWQACAASMKSCASSTRWCAASSEYT